MILEGLFGAIYALHTAVSLWSLTQIRRFLEETPAIRDEMGLRRYKGFVRIQMYLALGVLGLLIPGVVIGMILVVRHGLVGLAAVVFANAWMFALGMYHKTWEVRARSLEVTSEALQQEYRRVSEVWVKKPLPDF